MRKRKQREKSQHQTLTFNPKPWLAPAPSPAGKEERRRQREEKKRQDEEKAAAAAAAAAAGEGAKVGFCSAVGALPLCTDVHRKPRETLQPGGPLRPCLPMAFRWRMQARLRTLPLLISTAPAESCWSSEPAADAAAVQEGEAGAEAATLSKQPSMDPSAAAAAGAGTPAEPCFELPEHLQVRCAVHAGAVLGWGTCIAATAG